MKANNLDVEEKRGNEINVDVDLTTRHFNGNVPKNICNYQKKYRLERYIDDQVEKQIV